MKGKSERPANPVQTTFSYKGSCIRVLAIRYGWTNQWGLIIATGRSHSRPHRIHTCSRFHEKD